MNNQNFENIHTIQQKEKQVQKTQFYFKKLLDKTKDMNYNDVNNKKREKKTKNSQPQKRRRFQWEAKESHHSEPNPLFNL